MRKLLCVHHANCADGMGAAWAVHRRFGAEVEFVAAKYGDTPQLSESCKHHSTTELCTDCMGTGYELGGGPFLNRDVLIVDFSYPRSVLEAMAREARSVLVLDHHATAERDLGALVSPSNWDVWRKDLSCEICEVETYEERNPDGGRPAHTNLAAIFDMTRSGAGLTWDYLYPDAPRPRLIDLVEDRDLWRFNHDPDTRRSHAVAASYGFEATPENLARWDRWHEMSEEWTRHGPSGHVLAMDWHNKLLEGEAILRAERKLVDGIVAGVRRTMRIAGHVVPVACCPGALASEVGNRLMTVVPEGEMLAHGDAIYRRSEAGPIIADTTYPPFSATYYDGADGRRHFSLRSTDASPFHCGDSARAIAERLTSEASTRIIELATGSPTISVEGHPKLTIGPGSKVLRSGERFNGGGHKNAAGFDAPIGWEGE